MSWVSEQKLLFGVLSWQVRLLRIAKYGSTIWTIGSGISSIILAFRLFHQGSGTFKGLLIAAGGTFVSASLALLARHIDHKSVIYDKLVADDIREKDIWRTVYHDLDKDARRHSCRVDEFDGMAGWTSPELNKRLLLSSGRNGNAMSYEIASAPWYACDPKDIGGKSNGSKLRRYLVESAIKQKRSVFNAAKVRLAADIDVGLSGPVRLQKTDYISSMMTDGVAFKNIYFRADDTTISDGWSFFLERVKDGWGLKSLVDSRSSNQLGASTLAFSSDGFLVLIDQTEQNQHSGGKLSPSGSGSFDWSDVENNRDKAFLHLVKQAAARELLEETGLDKEADFDLTSFVRERMAIIGFTRLIHRGGKPEFFCVARLSKTMDNIRALTPKKGELQYSAKSLSHDASAFDDKAHFVDEIQRVCHHYADTDRLFSGQEKTRRLRLSYQVLHGLALLQACLSDSESVEALKRVLISPVTR
jgi:hypothetical protein